MLALAIVSVFIGAYVEIDYSMSTGFGTGGLFFLSGFLSAFLIGAVPVALYGAPIYAYYRVEPKFPFVLVLLASALPGILWIFLASPDRNAAVFLAAGPAVALILHLFSCGSEKGSD